MAAVLNLIGAGKVGRVLARLLAGSGMLVQDVLTRSEASAREAVAFIGAGRAVASMDQLRAADIWLLAVSDDQIASVCAQLAALYSLDGNVVFHCSGAMASDALQGAPGAYAASVHPVRSFADPAHVAQHFGGTFCGVEGDPRALAVLTPAMLAIGARVVPIDAAAKTVYHAASVFASNYLVTVMDAALRAYQAAGIPADVARALAAPLATETLANVLTMGPEAALTGPIARGDMAVVARQQAALAGWEAQTGQLYGALAEATVRLARRRDAQNS